VLTAKSSAAAALFTQVQRNTFHSNSSIQASNYFFEFDTAGRRGHERKLFKKRFRLDIRKFTFSNRVIDNWNSLPDCCANADSINCFKRHVSLALEPETV